MKKIKQLRSIKLFLSSQNPAYPFLCPCHCTQSSPYSFPPIVFPPFPPSSLYPWISFHYVRFARCAHCECRRSYPDPLYCYCSFSHCSQTYPCYDAPCPYLSTFPSIWTWRTGFSTLIWIFASETLISCFASAIDSSSYKRSLCVNYNSSIVSSR
jgi:hypothetical protein